MPKNNAHFNAHKNPDNAQLKAHYPIFKVCNISPEILLTMFFTPRHLKLSACGMPAGVFVLNSPEGYRILAPNKIPPTYDRQTKPAPKAKTKVGGGKRKEI